MAQGGTNTVCDRGISMQFKRFGISIVASAVFLSGCSFTSDALFPSFLDDDDDAPATQVVGSAEPVQQSQEFVPAGQPATFAPMPAQTFSPVPAAGFSTGTFVSQKVAQFRSELSGLQGTLGTRSGQLEGIRGQTVSNATAYHGIIGGIKSRLQVGTTPGNPALMAEWQRAQSQLTLIDTDIASLNNLARLVATDSAMSNYLLDSVRAAYNLAGAVDEDHRQLRQMEDATNQTVVTIERLLSQINEDIMRQQQYVARERDELNSLALDINAGQLYGGQRGGGFAQPASAGFNAASPSDFSSRRPLVVIRFANPNVEYEAALYQAVSRALERRPDAMFDLVAVSPGSGNQDLSTGTAQRNAERVLQSLSTMGLPSDRVQLSAMANPQARSAEVHVYVR